MAEIVFDFRGTKVPGGPARDSSQNLKTMDIVAYNVEEKIGLQPGTFDIYDYCGKITTPEDLQRALQMAGDGECVLEIKEHSKWMKMRDLKAQLDVQMARQTKLEAAIKATEERGESTLDSRFNELKALIGKIENKLARELGPTVDNLCRDRTALQRETRAVQEKLAGINVAELTEMTEKAVIVQEEVRSCVRRVNKVDSEFAADKARIDGELTRNFEEVKELQRYMHGKIDVCVETDADLKREMMLTNERMQLLGDDLKLHQEDFRLLSQKTRGALEESEELRTLLGTLREDNALARSDLCQMRTRVHCIEGTASEQWQGFAPGILHFRRWHSVAKGCDVQLSGDLQKATGRGFLAATGVIQGTDEGLAVGDGPCRRFGTPGSFSSYFEIEVDEICAAPAGAGGLYVGVCVQNGEEIAKHPHHEFDGWLIGGTSKALTCRRGTADRGLDDDLPPPSTVAPAAFGADTSDQAAAAAAKALSLLRAALPPRPKGEIREVEAPWRSDELRMGNRVGVLFRLHRDGGAFIRVSVNGDVKVTHEFVDAPPAEAVGLLTPVVRLAGTGKCVRLLPGLSPPARMLAD